MRHPKARVTKDRAAGQWVVQRPRLGFGGPETRRFGTHAEALRWLFGSVGRQGTLASQVELRVAELTMASPGSGLGVMVVVA